MFRLYNTSSFLTFLSWTRKTNKFFLYWEAFVDAPIVVLYINMCPCSDGDGHQTWYLYFVSYVFQELFYTFHMTWTCRLGSQSRHTLAVSYEQKKLLIKLFARSCMKWILSFKNLLKVIWGSWGFWRPGLCLLHKAICNLEHAISFCSLVFFLVLLRISRNRKLHLTLYQCGGRAHNYWIVIFGPSDPHSRSPIWVNPHALMCQHTRAATHSQSDRQIEKCITGVSPQTHTHTQNWQTPPFTVVALFTHDHYSSAAVYPIIPHIPASRALFYVCRSNNCVFFLCPPKAAPAQEHSLMLPKLMLPNIM